MIRTCSVNSVWKVPYGMKKISIAIGKLGIQLDGVANELAPTWDMVNIIKKGSKDTYRDRYGNEYIENSTCEEVYTRVYTEDILDKLDAREILNKYGTNVCFICFCGKGAFCHRHIVAKWIQENTGEIVTEL